MKKFLSGLKASDRLALSFSAVVSVILILLLIISLIPSAFTKLDLTPEDRFTLGSESKTLAKSVKEEVKLYLITSSENKGKDTLAVLERYARYGKKLSVEILDADADKAKISEHLTYDESADGGVIVESAKRSLYIPHHLFLSYGDEALASASQVYSYYYSSGETDLTFSEFLAYYGEYFGLNDGYCYESRLNTAIKYVTAESLQRLCFVSGSASAYFSDSIAFRFAANMIEILDTDLESEEIPSDADGVLIMPAQESSSSTASDITANAKAKLSAYLSGGGRIILSSSYGVNAYPNLSALCAEMGLSSSASYVFEDTAQFYYGSSETLLPTLKGSLSGILGERQALILPLCTEIKVSDTLPEGVSATPLIVSSQNGYVKNDLSSGYAFNETTDIRAERYLGVSAKNALGGELIYLSSSLILIDDFDYYSGDGNKTVFFSLINDGEAVSISSLTPEPKTVSAALTPDSTAIYATLAVGILLFIAPIAIGMILGFRRNR